VYRWHRSYQVADASGPPVLRDRTERPAGHDQAHRYEDLLLP